MSSIKLSICIPTYNREKHLHDCLERCHNDFRFDFPYEIVISDNASTDNTAAVAKEFIERGMPIRYVRGAENVGMIPNMNSALRLGRGDYILYLADDDRLIAKEVANIVTYLDENPNITVCHAPWVMYDGINEVEGGQFYTVNEDKIFPEKSFAEVFNYMFRGHIFPEIGIYRSSAFRASWVPRDICFYPFPMLAHFLDQGDIVFRKTPFYRQVIASGVERDRVQGVLRSRLRDGTSIAAAWNTSSISHPNAARSAPRPTNARRRSISAETSRCSGWPSRCDYSSACANT